MVAGNPLSEVGGVGDSNYAHIRIPENCITNHVVTLTVPCARHTQALAYCHINVARAIFTFHSKSGDFATSVLGRFWGQACFVLCDQTFILFLLGIGAVWNYGSAC
jgi:hypothetical protein